MNNFDEVAQNREVENCLFCTLAFKLEKEEVTLE